jgi:hypothetical protein
MPVGRLFKGYAALNYHRDFNKSMDWPNDNQHVRQFGSHWYEINTNVIVFIYQFITRNDRNDFAKQLFIYNI